MSRRVTKLVQPTSEERFWLGSVILLIPQSPVSGSRWVLEHDFAFHRGRSFSDGFAATTWTSTMNHTQLEQTLICETKFNRSGGHR
jgi:hypothetical protein